MTNRNPVMLDGDTKQLLETIHYQVWGDAGAPYRLTIRQALQEFSEEAV